MVTRSRPESRCRTKVRRGEMAFDIANLVFLVLVGLVSIYPFLYTLTISFSTPAAAEAGGLHLFPAAISTTAYRLLLSNREIMEAFWNTIVRTVLGTILTLAATCLAAYPLSRRQLPHRSMITFLILFTMIFSGGIVPSYLLVQGLGLINTVWALVIPTMLTAFNVIVLRNFFMQIPESLHEAARLERASELQILLKVFIPLSIPVLATIALWTAIAQWNSWFDAMLYINDDHRQVLQNYLQRIVIQNSTQLVALGSSPAQAASFTATTLKSATVILTVIPMLIVYPFVQRYFTKGIMLGAIKE